MLKPIIWLIKIISPILELFFSPTKLIASKLKEGKTPEAKTILIQKLNITYLFITLIIALILIFCTTTIAGADIPKLFYANISQTTCYSLFIYVISYYSLSRSFEIFFAFAQDAHSQLSGKKNASNLKYYERLVLAARSYVELIFLYGIIFYSISFNEWGLTDKCNNALNAWESLYFSGVTITTLGYGDYSPNGDFPQFLAVFEVLNGFTLIVVCFAIYVSMSINEQEGEK